MLMQHQTVTCDMGNCDMPVAYRNANNQTTTRNCSFNSMSLTRQTFKEQTQPPLYAPMESPSAWWDNWVEEALATLDSLNVLRSLRPICLRKEKQRIPFENELQNVPGPPMFGVDIGAFEMFDEMQQRDRSSVEVEIGETTFQRWMHDTPSSGILYNFVSFNGYGHMFCSLMNV